MITNQSTIIVTIKIKGIMKIINNYYHNQRQIFLYLTYIDANYVMIGPPDLQHYIKMVWSILKMFSSLNFMPTVKVPFSHIFVGPEIFQTIYTCYIISILSLWLKYKNKANLRDLIAATGLVISNWIQIVDFQPVWLWNLMDDLEKQ